MKTGKTEVAKALRRLCSIVEGVTVKNTFSSNNKAMLTLNILFPKPIGIVRAASLLNLDQGLITRNRANKRKKIVKHAFKNI